MKKIRRVDFSPDEWLAGTAELGEFDRGVYITICALIYSRGERIGEELIFRHCRAHGNAIRAALVRLEEARKIVRNGSEIGQKRSENELENARIRLEKHSENGTKGNKIRWNVIATRVPPAIATINHQPSTIIESPNGDSSPPLDPPLKPKAKSNGPKQGIALPPDWHPSAEDRAFATGLGLDADRVAAEFVDYWRSTTKDFIKRDWSATFRNHCRYLARNAQQGQSDRNNRGASSIAKAARIALAGLPSDG
ncbi:MAG TPA: hypothetical protein VGR84_18730 [Candidatus Acidoferrales bacterium]|nr:hypothetical protein [Candidatus Acidoferrales bacterium]